MGIETRAVTSADLKQLATDVVKKAMRAGATDAEVVIREGDEFSTLVRLGQVDTLKESGSRGMGLRVFSGQRTASTSTSDFSPQGVENLISGAIALSRVTSEDPFAGMPEDAAYGSLPGDLATYYEDVYSLPAEERIAYARRAEVPRWKQTCASRTATEEASTLPRAIKSSQIHAALLASIAVPIAPSQLRRSRRKKKAACSAITGIRQPAHLRNWSRPSRSEKKQHAAHCAV